MEKIGIKEIQKHLLGIAKEFDRICTKHNIPYFMLYGTMLGAIRHKGFIPWDDDMDFGVPIEYYKQLEGILENELQSPYRLCTFKNNPASVLPYIKIEDSSTVMYKETLRLPIEKQMGVNIDILPLNRCNVDDPEPFKLKRMTWLLGGAFTNSKTNIGFWQRLRKALLRLMLGGKPIYIQRRIENKMYKVNNGNRIGFILGAATRNTVPIEWYGKGKRYEFEDTSFVGPVNYDGYLSHIFHDYMTLPPEDKRPSHSDNVFLR